MNWSKSDWRRWCILSPTCFFISSISWLASLRLPEAKYLSYTKNERIYQCAKVAPVEDMNRNSVKTEIHSGQPLFGIGFFIKTVSYEDKVGKTKSLIVSNISKY